MNLKLYGETHRPFIKMQKTFFTVSLICALPAFVSTASVCPLGWTGVGVSQLCSLGSGGPGGCEDSPPN